MGERLDGVSLALRAGEITAIAGVSGNGQAALVDLLCGLRAADAGTVTLGGRPLPAEPRAWIAAGAARIPDDRRDVGTIGDLPVWENAIAERYRKPFASVGLVRRGAARSFARKLVDRYDVRGGGIDVPARTLSGGNMQKLILGRALSGGADARRPFRADADRREPADLGARRGRGRVGAPADARRVRAAAPRCCWCPRTWTRSSRSPTASR